MADDLQIVRARAEGGERGGDAAARERLVALTLVHGERAVAWEALAAWARTHDDIALYARALSELARRGLGRRGEIAAITVTLAGEGEVAAARGVAGALADGPADTWSISVDRAPLVARLAVDDAIVGGDADLVRLRATRTHMALEQAAGRALLLGDGAMARALAAPVAAADRHAVGARLVLAVCAANGGDDVALAEAFHDARAPGTQAPSEAALPFAMLLARDVSQEDARAVLVAMQHAPIQGGDAVATPIAVELAARGILREGELPLDAALELAVRRSQPPPRDALVDDRPGALDARHELLARVVAEPDAPRTKALAARMAMHARDPLVAVALARLALTAHPETLPADASSRLLARGPGDPLVAAAALDVARRRGDVAAVNRARAALTAVAQTPAERKRVE
jgi:hypothetical protein